MDQVPFANVSIIKLLPPLVSLGCFNVSLTIEQFTILRHPRLLVPQHPGRLPLSLFPGPDHGVLLLRGRSLPLLPALPPPRQEANQEVLPQEGAGMGTYGGEEQRKPSLLYDLSSGHSVSPQLVY